MENTYLLSFYRFVLCLYIKFFSVYIYFKHSCLIKHIFEFNRCESACLYLEGSLRFRFFANAFNIVPVSVIVTKSSVLRSINFLKLRFHRRAYFEKYTFTKVNLSNVGYRCVSGLDRETQFNILTQTLQRRES